jgi:hypothetical protein
MQKCVLKPEFATCEILKKIGETENQPFLAGKWLI